MLYYKIVDDDYNIKSFITLQEFRFYHPLRKRMFVTTELEKAQYVIFNGQYYCVPWLAEVPELKGKYPYINLFLSDEEEYKAWLENQKSE